ncbi:hypothetical protein CCP3SC1_430012 [Gammaproteobacteria bacterium]
MSHPPLIQPPSPIPCAPHPGPVPMRPALLLGWSVLARLGLSTTVLALLWIAMMGWALK